MRRGLVVGVLAVLAVLGTVLLLRARKPSSVTASSTTASGSASSSRPVPIAGAPELELVRDADAPGLLRLEGQVIDAADKPVAGAIVTINSVPPRIAKSDAGGSFVFEKLIGRTYALVARARGQAAGPVAVRLTAKTEPVTLRLAPAATVEVEVVTAADKRPVAGAQVELRGLEIIGATTARDGKVSFEGVSPGDHALAAWAPGFARSFSRFRVAGQFVATGVVVRQKLELRAGAQVKGRVLAATGQPVAGAAVAYASAANPFDVADPRRDGVTTDAGGNFRFDALPAGTFRFFARHDQYGPGVSQPITLDGAGERSGVEVRLEAGASIDGLVVAKAGAPVPWATLRVVPEGRAGFEPPRQTSADGEGKFRMTGLPRRTVGLVAMSETASSETMKLDLAATPEQHDVRVTLALEESISGVVVDGNGKPLPDVSVWAMQRGFGGGGGGADRRLRGPQTDRTDMGGRFELRGLASGTYFLFATRSGDLPFGGPRRGRDGGTTAKSGDTGVRVVLEAGGGIKGRVLLADGHAPPFFTVRIGNRGGTVPFSSADGAFLLEDVPSGEANLVVGGPGFEPGQAVAQVSAGHIADVGTITVKPGRTITGHVWNANHQAVAGANVYGGATIFGNGAAAGGSSPNPGGGSASASTTSDEQGAFMLAGVGASGLVLLAEHESQGRSRAVTVPASTDSTNVDLVLAPFASLDGTVTQDGRPAEGMAVTTGSQTAPDAIFTVTTGPDGTFRFDRLAPDTYRVSAMGGRGRGGRGIHSAVVSLAAGQTGHVNLSFDSQGVTLVVTTQPDGTPALVYVVQGAITATNAKALRNAVAASGSAFSAVGMSFGQRPARISGVKPGAYTICAFAMPPGIQGGPAAVTTYIAREGDKIPTACVPQQVADDPPEQQVTVSLPAPPAQH